MTVFDETSGAEETGRAEDAPIDEGAPAHIDLRAGRRPVLRIAGFEPGHGRIADDDRRALVDALFFPMGFAWGQQVLPPTPLDPSAHSAESFDCGVDALNAWLRDRTARPGGAETWVLANARGQIAGYLSMAEVEVRGEAAGASVHAVALTRLAVDLAHHGQGMGRSLLAHLLLDLRNRTPRCDAVVALHSSRGSTWWRDAGVLDPSTVGGRGRSQRSREGGSSWGRRGRRRANQNRGGGDR
jgi:ribosomal protein S18 acetylase RimI-like enzyme